MEKLFFLLLLCHFIADYPLQTDKMILAKKHWRGLIAHSSVHLMVMVVVVIGIARVDEGMLGLYFLLITVLHYIIDSFKNLMAKVKPTWIVSMYLIDQLLHILTIVLVTWLISETNYEINIELNLKVIIYALGYTLITYVYFISERIITYKNKAYQYEIAAYKELRMISRTTLLTSTWIMAGAWQAVLIVASLLFEGFNIDSRYRSHIVLIDASVVLGMLMLIRWVMGSW